MCVNLLSTNTHIFSEKLKEYSFLLIIKFVYSIISGLKRISNLHIQYSVVFSNLENQKAKHGGISFDVILKPATETAKPIQLSPREPVKKRELSQEQINNKLKRASERKSVRE